MLGDVLRAVDCGAVSEAAAVEAVGVSLEALRTRSFAAIVGRCGSAPWDSEQAIGERFDGAVCCQGIIGACPWRSPDHAAPPRVAHRVGCRGLLGVVDQPSRLRMIHPGGIRGTKGGKVLQRGTLPGTDPFEASLNARR